MRSRYSAFALANVAYLQATQVESNRDQGWDETAVWCRSVLWLSLSIVRREAGLETDETGCVEFVARYLEGQAILALREKSTFVRREGRWLYAKGENSVAKTKLERNDACPCGSGRKFKQCHA